MSRYNKFSLLIFGAVVALASCKKYDGDSYDFSNKTKDYIRVTPGQALEINTTTVDTVIGTDTFYYFVEEPAMFRVETRMAFGEDVTFNYAVNIDNGASENRQGVLEKGVTFTDVDLGFDEAAFGADSAISGTVILTGASGAAYGSLRLGYPLENSNISIPFTANKPNVLHPY